MKICLRWFIAFLLILAFSSFLLILALPFLFTPNEHKAFIIDLVREQTGRELSIAGGLQLTISPGLNMTFALEKVRLGNNAPFANSTFFESEQAKIELSIWPYLLQRRLYMTSIIVDGATLNLIRNKEGMSNWQNMANPSIKADESPKDKTTAAESKQKQPSLTGFLPHVTGLDFGKLNLTHVNVRFDNRQTDKIIVLKDLKIRTGRLMEKEQFPFETAFNLTLDNKDQDKPVIIRSGDIVMQGNATLFLQDPHLLLEDLRMETTVKGKTLPKRGLKFFVAGNSDIQLRQQKITLKDFSLTHEGMRLQGHGTLEDISSPRFNLSLKIPEYSPKSILKQLKSSLPILQNTDPFTHLRAEMQVKGDMERAEITDLTVMLDETAITGSIQINDIRNHPAYAASIHINHLDLDRYAPPKKEAAPVSREEQEEFVAEGVQLEAAAPIIPVHFLQDLLLQLDLQLDSVTVGGAELSQVQIRITGQDGKIQLVPLTAHLYDGSIKIEASIDVTGDIPQLQIKPYINKIQLGPLFLDMTGKAEISGTALIQADINSSGLSREELLNHINGTMQFELLNGEIKPVTILHVIKTTLAAQQKQETPPVTDGEATRFVRLTGTGIFKDGVLYNEDLMAASEIMQMTGAGELELARQQIDLKLNISLLPSYLDEDSELSGFSGRIIPYKIFGPISDLSQEADVITILRTETWKEPQQGLPDHNNQKSSLQKKNGSAASPDNTKKMTEGD
ncbi:MAG: AsmA family protein [Desulfocapsaceae bacterium]|nr:AsmA family protein [Desulfocapsaceae bacterium]